METAYLAAEGHEDELERELGDASRRYGRLFVAPGEESTPPESVMVASSYGAVYGALLDGASQLYIVDTVNVREYAYRLAPGTQGEKQEVSGRLRRRGQAAIRETIEAIAALHGYEAER